MRRFLCILATALFFYPIGIACADNLALNGIATQSSTGYNDAAGFANADRAVDGNTDGYFYDKSVSTTLNSSPEWWQVDLQDTYAIDSIVIWNRTDDSCGSYNCGDRLHDFYLEILDQQGSQVWNQTYSTFTQTTTAGTPGTVSSGMAIDLSGLSISGEIVKIGMNYQQYLQLAEVQVFGPSSPAAVPEPATMLLFGTGIVGLGALRRKI
jgi:NedA-like, galactose-binding domain/PEP-CTERM motif